MKLENFIVFEGLDGAGTTTQARLLCKNLTNGFFTCEPTGKAIGKLIRKILKSEEDVDLSVLPYLFAADRAHHVLSIRKQAVENVVVCDRYLFSSLAYQSLDNNHELIYDLNKNFPLPDIVFFIDTPVETAMNRVGARENREIFEKTALQKKVYENYMNIFTNLYKDKLNLYMLDGTKTIKQIQSEIVFLLEKTKYKKFTIKG